MTTFSGTPTRSSSIPWMYIIGEYHMIILELDNKVGDNDYNIISVNGKEWCPYKLLAQLCDKEYDNVNRTKPFIDMIYPTTL